MKRRREFSCLDAAQAFDPGRFLRLRMGRDAVGWLRHDLAEHLRAWPSLFRFEPTAVVLSPLLGAEPERSAALAGVVERLAAEGVITGWRNERYAVAEGFAMEPLVFIERAAARFFGIATYAAHVNAVTRRGGELMMWIARRSGTKPIDPGMLDNLVGGGIAHGLTPRETLIKEGWEEAGIPREPMERATPGRRIRVLREVPEGAQNEQVFVHDLELAPDFVPSNQDGEVAEFRLCTVEEVLDGIGRGELTVDASLVALDFLFRRGLLTESEYPQVREIVLPG